MLLFWPEPNPQEDWNFVLEIYKRFRRLMLSTAQHYAPQEAEDIMQDTLISLCNHVETLRGLDECKTASYVKVAVIHTGINYYNQQQTRNQHFTDNNLEDMGICGQALSPEEILLMAENAKEFWQYFRRLSEADQVLLNGKYILRLSDEELSVWFQCKPASIRMKLTRAKRRAAEVFQGGGFFVEQN